ncbi:MAG: AI-2E family transporter [Clostridia bacterium]|nr:AI-2E family transporter [Clostridia bacterium]
MSDRADDTDILNTGTDPVLNEGTDPIAAPVEPEDVAEEAAAAEATDAGRVDNKRTRTRDDDSIFRRMGNKLSEGTYRTVFGVLLLLILATKIIFDFDGFRGFVSDFGRLLISLLGYLLVGFIIAYVLNAFVNWLSDHPLKKIKSPRKKRIIGIVIAYIMLAAILAFLIGTIVPKLVESVTNLAKLVPGMAEKVYDFYIDVVEKGKFDLPEVVTEGIVQGIEGIKNWLMGLLNSEIITKYVPKILSATGSTLFKVVMGLLVSVYMLLEKDRALDAAKRINYGLFKRERADRVADGGRKIDMIFKQYFAGKLLQAVVILLLSYVVLLIGNIKYAILFATVIAITNMIPYIGPWIGGIPTVLICLVQDPWMGVRALICVLTIQIIDNWFLTPRIVGHKMGISPLLVLIGLGIGGTLFGFVGVLIGDVLAAIAKVLFYDTFIAHRIERRIAMGELPPDYRIPGPEEAEKDKKPMLVEKLWAKIKQFFCFLGRKIKGLFKKRKNGDHDDKYGV